MKIIIAHYKFYIQGGPERYLFKFISLAEKNGCEVIPFSVDYSRNRETPYSRYFVSPSSSVAEFGKTKLSLKQIIKDIRCEFHNPEAYRKIKELIREEKPDLLYVLIPGMLSADIFRAAKEENVPVILRISDFRLLCPGMTLLRDGCTCEECIYGNYLKAVKHCCVKKSKILSILRAMSTHYARCKGRYNLVDAVITPPKFTADIFRKSGYFPSEKLFVNPTFIESSEYKISKVSDNYVLCLGRFSPEKGFTYVVEAMRYITDIPVKVAITGDKDNCDASLIDIIEKYHLEDKVLFTGFLQGEDLEELTSKALCIAAPAIWYENLPNVVLEAYAYGKPVIASRIGSLSEIVDEGITGLLFEVGNSKEIAECIRTIYTDTELRKRMGNSARIKCQKEYSPEAHWQRFIQIYETVIRRGEV